MFPTLHKVRTKSYFLNQIFWFSPWKRPFCICTALLMVDRPTGTQSWQLSRSELVIQRHFPPTSIPLSYYPLLGLYSKKSRTTSNQTAVLKSLSFPPQVSVSVKFPFTQPPRLAVVKPFFPSAYHRPASCHRSSGPARRLLPQQSKPLPSLPYRHGPARHLNPCSRHRGMDVSGWPESPFRSWQPR